VEVAAQQGRLAAALADVSQFAEAETQFRRALERISATGAKHSPQAVQLETDLAEMLDRSGRNAEAAPLFQSALERARSQLGPRHPQVAQILIRYGFLLNNQDRYAEGGAALDEAISILEPLGHYDAAAALRYKGISLAMQERLTEAREAYARAERMQRARVGADHPLTWAAAVNLAYVDALLGDVAGSEARLREAIAALERIHGADSNDVRVPRKYLGEVMRMARRYSEAEAIHRAALEQEARLFGSQDTLASAATKHQIALDLLESGRPDRLSEARRLVAESLAFLRAHPSNAGRLGEYLTTSGRISAAQGDRAAARSDLAEARDLLARVRGEDAPSTRTARRALAALAP
jgi:serine/threonine-protein kinase